MPSQNQCTDIVDRLQKAVSTYNPSNVRDFMMRFLWLEEYGNRWLLGDVVPSIGIPSGVVSQGASNYVGHGQHDHRYPHSSLDVLNAVQPSVSTSHASKSRKSSNAKRGNLHLNGNLPNGGNGDVLPSHSDNSTGPNMKRRHTFEVHTDSDLHHKLQNYKMSNYTTDDTNAEERESLDCESEHDDSSEITKDSDIDSKHFAFRRQHSNTSLNSRYNSDDEELSTTPSKFDFGRRAYSFSVHSNSKRSYVDIDSNESDAIRRRYSISHDRRRGISSEIIDMAALSKHKPPVNPKSDDEKARLANSTSNNVLFTYLEEDDKQTVYDAMFEKKYKAGETIITQGADGDNFYVVDSGECEIYQKGEEGDEKLIKTVAAGDSFGELALIYGQPRAATVRAKTDVKCWAIDRLTFRKIMMETTLKKRSLYEEFLKKVTILEDLTRYERMTVADALVPCEYKDGAVIIREGSLAFSFYIIVEGEVKVTKRMDGEIKEVGRLTKGNYFGELALLFDQPRAATVIAVGNVKCIKMDRKSFNNLLGPCMSILKRNLEKYNEFMTQKMI